MLGVVVAHRDCGSSLFRHVSRSRCLSDGVGRCSLTSGSSALYLFLYSLFYFYTKLDITKLVPGLMYFGEQGGSLARRQAGQGSQGARTPCRAGELALARAVLLWLPWQDRSDGATAAFRCACPPTAQGPKRFGCFGTFMRGCLVCPSTQVT